MNLEKKMDTSAGYVWFDAEFTSLELEQARLLQVAAMLTDTALKPIGEPINLFIRIEDDEPVSAWVQENLPGLVAHCRSDAALSITEVDEGICCWFDALLGGAKESMKERPVLAGNSVHNDWLLARRFLPEMCSRLHYRLLDVSGLKIQWQDWAGLPAFDKEDLSALQAAFPEGDFRELNAHDALFDIKASIAELAYYRAHLRVIRSVD